MGAPFTYFRQTPTEAASRCIELYKTDERAGIRFLELYCTTIAETLDDVGEFVALVLATIGTDRVAA